jgi:transposase InsO family protein
MAQADDPDRWAQWRFAIIGPLLAAPPPQGQLRTELQALADKTWTHPINGTALRVSFATLERWFYQARKADNPVSVLRRRPREDHGRFRGLSAAVIQALVAQYQAYPGWTVQLHYDNLVAWARAQTDPQSLASYSTIRRFMKARGWQRKRPPKRQTAGAQQAAQRLQQCEVRSYEVDYVHGLWHADFHHGSRRVLTASGAWITPLLLCFMDDHSRVICHLQWYANETTEVLVHGLSQALQKHGLPRALMTDNGAAMQAEEFSAGLQALSILHEPTLPYSPYQNAKQETFWATLEGRLMAMLEGVTELSLTRLNALTQAWVEQEYHQRRHAELDTAPRHRYLDAKSVGRACPAAKPLRQAFRCTVKRKQRRSDGTCALAGKRFEIPSRYRHLAQVSVRYARWDLSVVDLIDPRTGQVLCPLYPLDKTANADGRRRVIEPAAAATTPPVSTTSETLPPLLQQYLSEYAATGCPPAYLPLPTEESDA